MEHKKLKFFSHISRLHNGFIFVPSFRGPPRGPGPRAPKLLKMALTKIGTSVQRIKVKSASEVNACFLCPRAREIGLKCYIETLIYQLQTQHI